jgi:hypothetical protein
MKTYWQRIKAFFGRRTATSTENGSAAEKDAGDRS